MSRPATSDLDYAREIAFDAPIEQVFNALTKLDRLAGWWTPIVSGNPATGGEIRFGFAGLDEEILMRVEEARHPSLAIWSCLTHTRHPEWEGTRILFQLEGESDRAGLLRFRHTGLIPQLSCYETCENGWDHFLGSLLDYAEHGTGSPF
jgi:uncharacterized protein YndB with AHSA1/START domain